MIYLPYIQKNICSFLDFNGVSPKQSNDSDNYRKEFEHYGWYRRLYPGSM